MFDLQKDDRLTDRPMDRSMDRPVKGQGSQVVFFSNLPREEEKKKELLTIAGRFGIVEKHLFLTDQVSWETFNQTLPVSHLSKNGQILMSAR